MMRRAPRNGAHVMMLRTGTPLIPADSGHEHRGAPMRGAPSRRPPPLRPHQEQEYAEGDAVHVVLRLPRLDVAERIPRAERPRARGVETSVDEIAVDEADEA